MKTNIMCNCDISLICPRMGNVSDKSCTESLNTRFIWSDFDRASSLIRGNKMPTRCNSCFPLQILLLAQHVSGTIMPIIRSSRVLHRWLLPVVFGAAAAARKPDTQPSAPHHTDNLKTKAPSTTGSNHLYNTLELLMMGIMVPETC